MGAMKISFPQLALLLLMAVFCNVVFSESNKLVSLEVKLEKYESEYDWYEEREDGFDDGVAPLARFKALRPEVHSSREISVLFNSQHYEALLPLLEKRVGAIFLIDVPVDFLEGKAKIIDAIYVQTLELKNP